MKAEQLYGSLKNLAERLDVTVTEQNLSTFKDLKTRSGLCRVKGSLRFILDKRLPLHQKNALLAECLASMPHETLFIAPAVRDFLQKSNPSKQPRQLVMNQAVTEGDLTVSCEP